MKLRRILFVSESVTASPTRYRALAYFALLRAGGWEPGHLAVTGLARRVALLGAARRADVIVVLRKAFSPALCALLRRGGRKLVFDFDDALFAADDGQTPAAIETRFSRMVSHVDAVWAGNAYLARHAKRYCGRVTVLPTSIDPLRYAAGAIHAGGGHFDLVWIGSSSTRKYLEALIPALLQASRTMANLRLKIIADFDLPAAQRAGIETVAIPWNESTEVRELQTAHVGLAPLPDDAWTRGKCGLKILQYMAAGLPVIASPVGVQASIVVPRETGFLAAAPDEWPAAMVALHANRALGAAMGMAGRERALADYSLDAAFPKMLAQLNELAAET